MTQIKEVLKQIGTTTNHFLDHNRILTTLTGAILGRGAITISNAAIQQARDGNNFLTYDYGDLTEITPIYQLKNIPEVTKFAFDQSPSGFFTRENAMDALVSLVGDVATFGVCIAAADLIIKRCSNSVAQLSDYEQEHSSYARSWSELNPAQRLSRSALDLAAGTTIYALIHLPKLISSGYGPDCLEHICG